MILPQEEFPEDVQTRYLLAQHCRKHSVGEVAPPENHAKTLLAWATLQELPAQYPLASIINCTSGTAEANRKAVCELSRKEPQGNT